MTEKHPPFLTIPIKNYFSKEQEIIKSWNYFANRTDESAGNCFLWNTPSYRRDLYKYEVGRFFSPRAGGWYFVDESIAFHDINQKLTLSQKACLTTWLVEERKKGFIPYIDELALDNAKKLTPMKSKDKAMAFLKTLAEGENIWEDIKIFDSSKGEEDFIYTPIIKVFYLYAKSEAVNHWDVREIISYLKKENYIRHPNSNDMERIKLTLEGKIATETDTNEDSDEGFIAMWFDKSMKEVSEAIKKGIEQAGYKPVRVDNIEHNRKIDDEIIAAIKRARFVVADFTYGEKGARGGVYYEAGFAHGLGINVVFTCREDIVDDIHFDTRQYNHITWTEDTLDDLTQQIANRISATVGDGPYKGKN